MPKRKPKNEFYIVLTPEMKMSCHSTAIDAAREAQITRNTLALHIEQFGKYAKRGYLIQLFTLPKKEKRGNAKGFLNNSRLNEFID